MLVIEVSWVPFCEDGWAATDGINEHAFILKVDGIWHAEVAHEKKGETVPYDSFRKARDHVFTRLNIDPHPRQHLQALFAAGYRRT